MEIRGKTALVTGAVRRVGRAIAEELSHAGAHVAIHHHASDVQAAALQRILPGSVVVKQDLRRDTDARKLVDAARAAIGRVDILVNNAADYARTPLGEGALTDQAWDDMLALNLSAPMRLIRECVLVGATVVVNIVDVAASQPWPNYSAYAVSKAGLLHLSRCLALELAPTVRVNAVAPGTVAFPEDWSDARRARQLAKIPLGRAGAAADVARAVRFLVEEDYLTGVCIPVDGGASLR